MKQTLLPALLLAFGSTAFAQAPSVSASSLSFSYLVNSGSYPKAQTLTATLPSTVPATTKMDVLVSSSPLGWLSVTPSGTAAGVSPLTLTVSVNPTSLSPGSYPGTIVVWNGSNKTTVTVTLAITSPPSSLLLNSTDPTWTGAGTATPALAMDFTSGSTLPSTEIDVSTTGDIIPFSVATAVAKGTGSTGTVANWLRVSNISNNGLPATSTSGVAAGGSNVRILVSLDQSTLDTLDSVPYTGTITIKPTNGTTTGSFTVTVTLNVSAGPPVICLADSPVPSDPCYNVKTPIFPATLPGFPANPSVAPIPPVITIYGDNFFPNASWPFLQTTAGPIPLINKKWVSRRILQGTIPVAYLTPPQCIPPQLTWSIVVVNGAPGATPSNTNATSKPAPFAVTDPASPIIQSVVNAASYLPTATQLGPNAASNPGYAVSPREIVSIFGQNFGPSAVLSNSPKCLDSPAPVPPATCVQSVYGTTIDAFPNLSVNFQVAGAGAMSAPLIMASTSQINAIVPEGLQAYIGQPVTVEVALLQSDGVTVLKYDYLLPTVVAADPGIFTFGGNGTGQSAVLNFDASTGVVTVNGKSAAAARGTAIEIFATGLGVLASDMPSPSMADGQVATGAIPLSDDTFRVLIGGQSAAVFYAGTAGNGVAGLVQINAIVPPSATTGAAVPITVEIGPTIAPTPPSTTPVVTARRSQAGVTIAIK